jgi:transposase
MWPGNVTDVTTLVPVADRLQKRFGVGKVCVVADRGMISDKVMKEIEAREWEYILGARMRRVVEVRDEVLGRAGRYQEVMERDASGKEKAPLKVKEVRVGEKRYVVCVNEDQARKDTQDREAIVEALRAALRQGDKALIGNKGYRKYVKGVGRRFTIDEGRIREEARFDGKWVLTTNGTRAASEVALQYKRLWMVEEMFRTMKSLLETRPIYHKCDETIRGHVFCSFLALVLRVRLQEMLEKKGLKPEWNDVLRDLDRVQEVETVFSGRRFVLRSQLKGCAGAVLRAVGVVVPPTIREL